MCLVIHDCKYVHNVSTCESTETPKRVFFSLYIPVYFQPYSNNYGIQGIKNSFLIKT